MKSHEWIAAMVLIALFGWMAISAFSPKMDYAAAGGAAAANAYAPQAAAGAQNVQNGAAAPSSVAIPVKVAGGYYEPREIRVKQGTKVRLELDKATFTGCMSTFNIWGLGISAYVPTNNIVEFVADKPGTYKTSCPMGMGDGRFIVEASDGKTANAEGGAAAGGANGAAADTAQLAGPSGYSCGMSNGGGCGCGSK